MSGNTFGKSFKVTTFGESHGTAIGAIIDGCPAGLKIDLDFIQNEMARRRPGQSAIVTQRNEADYVELLSGVFEGVTTGTPIGIYIKNKDARSKDYSHISEKFRPSHADFTFTEKYGVRDYRGGGRSSARETACRVAAGAIAKQFLANFDISINAYVDQVGSIVLYEKIEEIDFSKIESNIVRCPDAETAAKMETFIKEIKKAGDTVGGGITCVIQNCPTGLGEPVFDKLHADLAKAIISINACKGFAIGSGFDSIAMRGSEHNDIFEKKENKIITKTNYSGGIQGGISNGMPIYFRAAFKPVATIIPEQKSVNKQGEEVTLAGRGRHDPCVVPRAVPIVEAMTALVLADHLLRRRGNKL